MVRTSGKAAEKRQTIQAEAETASSQNFKDFETYPQGH